MVKLIRLQGDASVSDTEIHNTFREPIIIQPNSKVALIGISANMAQDLGNSLFEITGITDGRFTIAPQAATANDIAEAQVDSGVWTLNQMRVKFEEAANYSVNSLEFFTQDLSSYAGLDHQVLYDDKFSIWTHQSALGATDFETDWTQSANAVIGSVLKNQFEASGGIVGIRQATKIVPRVSATLSATLDNADAIFYELYAAKSALDTITFGVAAKNGFYEYIVNGAAKPVVDVSGAIVASAGDKIILKKVGGSLAIYINDSAGDPVGAGDPVNLNPGLYYYRDVFTKNQNNEILHWSMIVEDGGTISDVKTTSISNHYAGLTTAVQDDLVEAFLAFSYDVGTIINNPILSTYMGWSGDTNALLYDGAPAKLRAPEPPQGISENAGVVVVIDGLGKLDSHDGSGFSKSMSNILYVLNTPDVLGQLLKLDVAAPFYLNMNNKFPININELRIRFLAFAGGTVLKFISKPSVTVLIDSA